MFKSVKQVHTDIDEADLNRLGYQYLETDINTALIIFETNIKLFPDSINVYDSYAEAFLSSDTPGVSAKVITYAKKGRELAKKNADKKALIRFNTFLERLHNRMTN